MRAAVVLAAGRGTRMRSERAKVLHELQGRPLVAWVMAAVAPLVERTVVVVGHERESVATAVEALGARTVVQEPQEGTGHALACAAPALEGATTLIVLAGDVPLLRAESLEDLVAEHDRTGAAATVMTFRAADPTGYGRILRGEGGAVAAIVEHADCDEEQLLVDECNSGTWVFDALRVLPLLPQLPRSAKGEFYLTDVVGLLKAQGERIAAAIAPESEALGINTPEQLADCERSLSE
jgi:bifunctional UDP-N-acetylglucosamine pyrophosphorylase/glucosamine-1-phosphate N-acetyltransferase